MDNPRRQRPFARRSDADALDAHKVETLESELRALPDLEAPGELWANVRERLDGDDAAHSPSPRRRRRQTPMAAAASVALIAVAAGLMWVHLTTGDIETTSDDGVTQRVDETPDHDVLIAALMEQSLQAEARRRAALAFYSVSGPEQVLRAQIGGIDAALNEQMFAGEIEPKSREALLRDRVDLMADLTDIERYRQHEFVQRVSF
ncbi:MAG: hypothetical protein OXQ90_12780 [Gammaproteobacteria bacterium]|nr:hypothetical protein [Gammaproteobacteria bacterium]